VERSQADAVKAARANRNAAQAESALRGVRTACQGDENLVPRVLDAVRAGVTLGEICQVFRDVFGEHHDPAYL